MTDAAHEPGLAALPAELLQAFVALSRDMLALTDATGTVLWANSRFSAATGYAGRAATSLLDFTIPGSAGSEARLSFARMLSSQGADSGVLQLRGPAGEAFWVDVHSARIAGRIIWTLADVTRPLALAARAARQEELLDTAQEFGRLGIWERDIPSGEGRWDKHVFSFWGIDPSAGTPNYADAIERIHPEDRARMKYADSTRRAGRYAQRYRVVHPDGTTRWIHSQWEVKNGPRDHHHVKDLRVLVVDDDVATQEALTEVLTEMGAEVKVAPSAAEAMTVVAAFHPQLLLCDIAMPGEDGHAFLRRLRAGGGDGAASIPALALTALATDDDRQRSLAAGFQMHLTKPVDIERLSEAVVELAGRPYASA